MPVKKFRLFAGPNGSGKTTLINEISKQFDIGYFINADMMESELTQKGSLFCAKYFPGELTQEQWLAYIRLPEINIRFDSLLFDGISIEKNYLISRQQINSYHASIIAEFFRENLLLSNSTFSFETVMSHPSKIDFLKRAKKASFKTYLYFISTQDPEINKRRVKNRVRIGGHDVWDQKVEDRYYRSLDLLYEGFVIADRAFVIDTSEEDTSVILEKKEGNILVYPDIIPEWVGKYLLDKLS